MTSEATLEKHLEVVRKFVFQYVIWQCNVEATFVFGLDGLEISLKAS